MSWNVLECHRMLSRCLVQILLQRLQAAEHRRADLMSKIGETEFMIQNMEATQSGLGILVADKDDVIKTQKIIIQSMQDEYEA